jgi:hypothetical protein
VAGAGGSIVFNVSVHRGWLVFPISYGAHVTLNAAFALTKPRSLVSRSAQRDIATVQRFLQQRGPDYLLMTTVQADLAYTLSGFRIEGQLIGDLDVRVSGALARTPFDILLGLDFIKRFGLICYNPHTSQISLEPPTF